LRTFLNTRAVEGRGVGCPGGAFPRGSEHGIRNPGRGFRQLNLRLLVEAGEPGDAPVLGKLEEVDPCEGLPRRERRAPSEPGAVTEDIWSAADDRHPWILLQLCVDDGCEPFRASRTLRDVRVDVQPVLRPDRAQ